MVNNKTNDYNKNRIKKIYIYYYNIYNYNQKIIIQIN